MKQWMMAVLLLAMGSVAMGQVTIEASDIPVAPGTNTDFFVEAGTQDDPVAVNVGSEGGNGFWNFTRGGTDGTMTEQLVGLDESPFADVFPTANRISFGPLPFGNNESATWRYDEVSDAAWVMQGFSIGYDDTQIPIEFPNPYQVMPLPLNIGDEWDLAINVDYPIDPADYDLPLPFDTLIVNLEMGGFFEADAWGQVALPGSVVPALRTHSEMSGIISATGIVWIGDWRIETPLGELYAIDATHTYSWHSPGRGEVAYVVSLPGEQNPDFTQASLVRRMDLTASPMVTCSAAPLADPVQIPANGGSFTWDAGIQTFINGPADADVWTVATLPNGNEVVVQQVELTLPANADLSFTGLQQAIPGTAPAGMYTWNLRVGVYPSVVVAEAAFPFEKLNGTIVPGEGPTDWMASPFASDMGTVAADADAPAATPDRFELGAVYPNPFNAAATVAITLPSNDHVQVTLVDMTGRTVRDLTLGQMQAGTHRVELNGSDLASGVYLVSVQTASHGVQIRKAVLVK